MPLQFSLLGALGTLAYVVTWVLALIVYAARPDRPQNRRLAFLLVLLGSFTFFLRSLRLFFDDPASSLASFITAAAPQFLLPFAYAAFLATLPTPLARPLRARGVLPALLVVGMAAAAVTLARPEQFVYLRVEPFPFLDAWSVIPAPAFLRFGALALVVPPIAALALALSAVRHAPSSNSRRQAVAFAWAFGIHDAIFAVEFTGIVFLRDWFDATRAGNYLQFGLAVVRAVLLPLLLSYGILRTQLFDIDLRIKWSIQKSTVVAAFAVTFLVASEVVERLLGVEGWAFGLAAAVAVGLAFRRVERAAERVADRVMPHVRDTQEYRTVRKREVYRAAVESALLDGTVTERERDMLATLAQELGLGPAEARAIEREAGTASAVPAEAG